MVYYSQAIRFWRLNKVRHLLGVEDTVDVKQLVRKGQKNEVSSTPRRSLKFSLAHSHFHSLTAQVPHSVITRWSLTSQGTFRNWFSKCRQTWERDCVVVQKTLWRSRTFSDLVTFVDREARIATNPVFGNISGNAQPSSDSWSELGWAIS